MDDHDAGIMVVMKLKSVLKRLIADSGITVIHLSRATKIPVQTLHNWLSGAEPKSLSQLKKVADYFEVSLDFLCFGIEAKPQKGIQDYEHEINAGVFEVVLRKVRS